MKNHYVWMQPLAFLVKVISDVYQVEKQKTGRASKEKLREIFEREANKRKIIIEDLSKQIEEARLTKEKYDYLTRHATLKIAHID